MIINEFSIIIVASKRLRVGWGEKEKGSTVILNSNYYHGNYATILNSRNTIIIMEESNILGFTIHAHCITKSIKLNKYNLYASC